MNRDEHIGRIVTIFANRINRRIGSEASKFGITGSQGRILGFLYHESKNRDIFQKDLEEELNIRRSSVTSILQLMEKDGYIKRVSVEEDARLKKIVLTEKGLEIQENVYNFILKFEKSLRDELNDDEAEILIGLLNRLSDKIAD
ncbi:MarR family transcriptional regulator [Clostridium sp. C8-1-8]|uniref:MarR family winged helix-turn-helix transcriptional regulator n=1 Tax=Clostridium sp. C8-1-8 TaxID=2698831 RepID=UPI00136DB227|nr:MarR family transcriptional regulator [Clostridium sp. C8-1-8]